MIARNLILLLAPLPIVSGSMALSHWAHEDPNRCATRNEIHVSDAESDSSLGVSKSAWQAPPARPWATDDLASRCRALANHVAAELGPDNQVIVATPLVIGGDLSESELQHWHDKTIVPAVSALHRDFFEKAPEHPITVLLFSNEATYREHAERLFGQRRVSIYGYYQPTSRTLVINLEAGGGTLVHELTHALVDFDFPEIPIWFNEGLASLHEHCDLKLTENGPVIQPQVNWRLSVLQTAIVEGRLSPTWELMQETSFRGRNEALFYAHARYFCFYLHEKGLLEDYYAKFRSNSLLDAEGDLTLRQLFPGQTWSQIERGFRAWVMKQHAPTDVTGIHEFEI